MNYYDELIEFKICTVMSVSVLIITQNYFNLNNYIFTDAINFGNKFKYIKKLNKNFKQVIIIFYGKSSKFFD